MRADLIAALGRADRSKFGLVIPSFVYDTTLRACSQPDAAELGDQLRPALELLRRRASHGPSDFDYEGACRDEALRVRADVARVEEGNVHPTARAAKLTVFYAMVWVLETVEVRKFSRVDNVARVAADFAAPDAIAERRLQALTLIDRISSAHVPIRAPPPGGQGP